MIIVIFGGCQVIGELIFKEGGRVEVRMFDGWIYLVFWVIVWKVEWGVYCLYGIKFIELEGVEYICYLLKELCDWFGELGYFCVDYQLWCWVCYLDGWKIWLWFCMEEGCIEVDFDCEQCEVEEVYYEEMCQLLYG